MEHEPAPAGATGGAAPPPGHDDTIGYELQRGNTLTDGQSYLHLLQAAYTLSESDYAAVEESDDAAREPGRPAVDPLSERGRLHALFQLDDDETILADLPCFFTRSVLVQGHAYLTQGRLCFYAHMPSEASATIKSGTLTKLRSRKSLRGAQRYWFVLTENALSYFNNPAQPFFPVGTIDLRQASTVDVPSGDEGSEFSIRMHRKTHRFRADSAASARLWAKAVKKQLFWHENAQGSVKLSIPLASILEAEWVDTVEFAKTLRVKVVDDDTYAVDEFYFAFMRGGDGFYELLQEQIIEARDFVKGQHGAMLEHDGDKAITTGSPELVERPDDLLAGTGASPSSSIETLRGMAPSASFLPYWVRKSRKSVKGYLSSVVNTMPALVPQKANLPHWPHMPHLPPLPDLMVPRRVGVAESGADYVRDERQARFDRAARFRKYFALPETEQLKSTYSGFFVRMLPVYGRIYLSDQHFCFRATLPGSTTRIVIPLGEVETAQREKGSLLAMYGLVLTIRGHEELWFGFTTERERDDCIHIANFLRDAKALRTEHEASEAAGSLRHTGDVEPASTSRLRHRRGPRRLHIDRSLAGERDEGHEEPVSSSSDFEGPATEDETDSSDGEDDHHGRLVFDSPGTSSLVSMRPAKPLRIVCLTIGSRGDVQPFIALCKGLLADGHDPVIATHEEFRTFVTGHGVGFAPVAGDPAELMRICVDYGMFTYSFLREASAKFRTWIDELLSTAWHACQGAQVLIEAPSAMGGIHIAEALRIPYFRAFTMPWTRTRAYPHAFGVPDHKMGGSYNYLTYVLFDSVFWKAIAGQVNKWRRDTLLIPDTNASLLQQHLVPFMYNFSPTVVPEPLDWGEWVHVTGYWKLADSGDHDGHAWQPEEELVEFLQKARQEAKAIVYIGFGSVVVPDSRALCQLVADAVQQAGVRCVLSKGWSDRLRPAAAPAAATEAKGGSMLLSPLKALARKAKEEHGGEFEFPPDILSIGAVPHEWLLPQVDVAVHHGGAGTTGACISAGIPSIIHPFFGDQFFWATRNEDLGIGVNLRRMTVASLAQAIRDVVADRVMQTHARAVQHRVRHEDGVACAIKMLYREMEYSRRVTETRCMNVAAASDKSRWASLNAPLALLPKHRHMKRGKGGIEEGPGETEGEAMGDAVGWTEDEAARDAVGDGPGDGPGDEERFGGGGLAGDGDAHPSVGRSDESWSMMEESDSVSDEPMGH